MIETWVPILCSFGVLVWLVWRLFWDVGASSKIDYGQHSAITDPTKDFSEEDLLWWKTYGTLEFHNPFADIEKPPEPPKLSNEYSYYEVDGKIVQRIGKDGVVHQGHVKNDNTWVEEEIQMYKGPGGDTTNPYWRPEQVEARRIADKIMKPIKTGHLNNHNTIDWE